MTADQFREAVMTVEEQTSRLVLALHAYEDAPDAPGRVIAYRSLTGALARLSHDTAALQRELAYIGVEP